MTDGRERAIGGHNKPIAIRSLACDAIGIAIHKFLATMVGNRESDFRGAQWIGRLLRLEGDALVGAHAFPVVDDRVQLALKPDGGRVVNLPTKLQLLLLRVPTEHQWSWIPFQIQQHFARPGSCLPTGTSAQVSA